MDEKVNKNLVIAAEEGDREEVKKALNQGADPNAMGPKSGALHSACAHGHEAVVAELLAGGSDVNLKDQHGFYPLHLAAAEGYRAIVKRLIDAGADLEAATEAGGTALHMAAASGIPEVTGELITAGAKMDVRDIEEATPLATASALGRLEAVKILLKAGADVNTFDDENESTIFKAVRCVYHLRIDHWETERTVGGEPVVYQILNGLFQQKRRHSEFVPLSLAEQRECASQSWGPSDHLHYLDALEICSLLMETCTSYGTANSSGQTPLSMACQCGEPHLIKMFTTGDFPSGTADSTGALPLHRIAGAGRSDGLKLFLERVKPSDLNMRDNHGWTPLHYLAEAGGPPKMAEGLLAAGADPSLKSTAPCGEAYPAGITAAEVALSRQNRELAELFQVE